VYWYKKSQNYNITQLIKEREREREERNFNQMSEELIQKILNQEQPKILGVDVFIPRPGVLLAENTPESIISENIERFGDFPITLIWSDKTKNIIYASEYLKLRKQGKFKTPPITDLEREIIDMHEQLSKLNPDDISKPEVQRIIEDLKRKEQILEIPKYLQEAFVSENWNPPQSIYDLREV